MTLQTERFYCTGLSLVSSDGRVSRPHVETVNIDTRRYTIKARVAQTDMELILTRSQMLYLFDEIGGLLIGEVTP